MTVGTMAKTHEKGTDIHRSLGAVSVHPLLLPRPQDSSGKHHLPLDGARRAEALEARL